MSKQSSPTAIGAFVVGAVILIAVGFAIFGGSQVFAKKIRYVALFDEPTNGLRVGANVLLNGVRIGYVTDIDLIIDEVNFDTDTQVVMELIPDDIKTRSGESLDTDFENRIDHDTLINVAGLRATLEIESFVTGQLRVELVMRPETVATMRAIDPLFPEIPTITSNIQELLNKVQTWFADVSENVDFGGISRRLDSVLEGIDQLARSEDLHESIVGLNRLLNSEETQQLAATLQSTLKEFRAATASAEEMFRQADQGVEILVTDLQPTIDNLNAALSEFEGTLAVAKSQLDGDSRQAYRLASTIDELQRAARSVREFFDYLERNPEALLRGKSE